MNIEQGISDVEYQMEIQNTNLLLALFGRKNRVILRKIAQPQF